MVLAPFGHQDYTLTRPYRLLGRSVLRIKLLSSLGLQILKIPFFEWGAETTQDTKMSYLAKKLQDVGIDSKMEAHAE